MSNENEVNQPQAEPKEAEVDTQTAVKDIDTIIANIHIVREQAKELEAQAEDLEKRLNLARGTGDVTAKAAIAAQMDAANPAPPPPAMPRTRTAQGTFASTRRPASNRQRVEQALKGQSLNTAQVAKAAGLSVGKVSQVLRELRADHRVANVGSEDFPKWTLRIGDGTPTRELAVEVRRLISDQPMSMQELVDATGAKMSRISGVIVEVQRTVGERILNLGTARRARWLLLGEGVRIGALASKKSPGDLF